MQNNDNMPIDNDVVVVKTSANCPETTIFKKVPTREKFALYGNHDVPVHNISVSSYLYLHIKQGVHWNTAKREREKEREKARER